MERPPVPYLVSCVAAARRTYIVAGEVASLEHEVGDDAVEDAALVVLARGGALADFGEVVGSLGDDVIVEDEVDASFARCAN
jgi:hypothetical protein